MKKLLVLWFLLLLVLPNEAKQSEITSQGHFIFARPSLEVVPSDTETWPLKEVLRMVDANAVLQFETTSTGYKYTLARPGQPGLVLTHNALGWQLIKDKQVYQLQGEDINQCLDEVRVSLRFLNRFFPERFVYDGTSHALAIDQNFDDQIVITEQTARPALAINQGYQTITPAANKNNKLDPTLVQLAFKSLPISLNFLNKHQVYLYPFLVSTTTGNSINAVTFPNNKTYLFTQNLLYESCYHETVTHELGHQILFRLKDSALLQKYLKIRGITNSRTYNNAASTDYKNRIHEIFAEDFRVLYGNDYATSLPHINRQLTPPEQVAGLKEVIGEILVAVED